MSSGTVILVDPAVSAVGIDLDALVAGLRGRGMGQPTLVLGLARHPELLAGAARASGARSAVIVTAEYGRPLLSELRMWGEAGGLAPLGVQVVALDLLRARRGATERAGYAVRMVRAAVAMLETPTSAQAVRRSVGASLSRRALFRGRATTWVPVVSVEASICLGSLRCGHCIEACQEDALQVQVDAPGGPPTLDAGRCGACSRCLDVCPSGALNLDGHDPSTLLARIKALFQGGDGAGAPALVIACQGAAEAMHDLGSRGGLPGWVVLELPCLGGVGSTWSLAALAAGARTVQILPCTRCLSQVSLTEHVRFTQDLLRVLGDVDAARRVGILPEDGLRLHSAVLAADGLTALVDETGVDRMPAPGAIGTLPRVAAWAVGELWRVLGRPVGDRSRQSLVIRGQGAPLGMLRAAEGCTACGVCERSCPTRALRLKADTGYTTLVLDPAACTGCGGCVDKCPERVLDVALGVDLGSLAGGCFPIARTDVATCPGCGEGVPAVPAAAHLTTLPAGLAGRCPRCRQAALVASV